jgi:hypothetical protein
MPARGAQPALRAYSSIRSEAAKDRTAATRDDKDRPHPLLHALITPERARAKGRVGVGWSTPWGVGSTAAAARPPELLVEAGRRNRYLQVSPKVYR